MQSGQARPRARPRPVDAGSATNSLFFGFAFLASSGRLSPVYTNAVKLMIKDLLELNALYPAAFLAVAFVFGAIVGSFLNVCILRIPEGRSIVKPGSHCACGAPIAWYDNIPVLSWFVLRGRARCCGRRFSFRYPAIELLTGLLFLLCWQAFPPAKAVCGMIFFGGLICASVIDLDRMEIPDLFSIGLALAGLALSLAAPGLHGAHSGFYILDAAQSLGNAVVGALVGSGLVLWIAFLAEALLKREAMGLGDVKFVGAIGAFTGWQGTVSAVFGGALVGTLWFLVALLWRKGFPRGDRARLLRAESEDGREVPVGLGTLVPFGPMLAIAGGIHFLWAHRWVDAYFQQLSILFR